MSWSGRATAPNSFHCPTRRLIPSFRYRLPRSARTPASSTPSRLRACWRSIPALRRRPRRRRRPRPNVALPPPPQWYPPPAVVGPARYPAAPRVANTSATIAFVLALLGLVLAPVVDIAAVIVGHHALGTIRRTGEAGAGLAKAALAIGYSLIGMGALVTAFLVSMIAGSVAH